MKLSKRAVRQQLNTILPESTVAGNTRTVWYTKPVIDENSRKYVRLREEDRQYIYHCLQRFLADYSQIQFIQPEMHREFYRPNTQLPVLTKEYASKSGVRWNSMNSYVSGLLSNYYRNPDVDFTQNQLKTLEFITDQINAVYVGLPHTFRAGYDADGVKNEIPLRIKFRG